MPSEGPYRPGGPDDPRTRFAQAGGGGQSLSPAQRQALLSGYADVGGGQSLSPAQRQVLLSGDAGFGSNLRFFGGTAFLSPDQREAILWGMRRPLTQRERDDMIRPAEQVPLPPMPSFAPPGPTPAEPMPPTNEPPPRLVSYEEFIRRVTVNRRSSTQRENTEDAYTEYMQLWVNRGGREADAYFRSLAPQPLAQDITP